MTNGLRSPGVGHARLGYVMALDIHDTKVSTADPSGLCSAT